MTDSDFVLWRFLNHTAFLILRARRKELAQYHLTPEQAYILDIINHGGGVTTINAIVESSMRQHHSISTQLQRMERRGLIKRIRRPNDMRKYDVVITEEGQELFRQVTRESIKTALSVLSPQEKRELLSSLRKLWNRAHALNLES